MTLGYFGQAEIIQGETIYSVSAPNVWKVFSQNLLSDEELKSIFTEIKEMTVRDWLAYPHYHVPEHQDTNM